MTATDWIDRHEAILAGQTNYPHHDKAMLADPARPIIEGQLDLIRQLSERVDTMREILAKRAERPEGPPL